MVKYYTEELAEWVQKRGVTKVRQDKNAVAFLAVKGDIQAAMDAGYSMLTIWEHLQHQGKISYRYETFTQHVRRHIKNSPSSKDNRCPEQPASSLTKKIASQSVAARPKPQSTAKPALSTLSAPPSPLTGFTFDAQPKKEDLL